MRKKYLFLGILAIVLIATVSIFRFSSPEDSWNCIDGKWTKHGNPSQDMPSSGCNDYKNISYKIDEDTVTLKDGKAEINTDPVSASKIEIQYFGNEAKGDLNGDGKNDVAFLIAEYGGGTGTFYYVVAALNTGTGYVGTNAMILGDRIAPQTTEIKDGKITVNFADRKADEPMTAQPSVGVSKQFRVVEGKLVEL